MLKMKEPKATGVCELLQSKAAECEGRRAKVQRRPDARAQGGGNGEFMSDLRQM